MAGWAYQEISQLNGAPDSWSAPIDVMRIKPSMNATDATVTPVRRLARPLPPDSEVPVFVFDAGYDGIALGADLADERLEVLCRIRDDRVFYADPPSRPDRTGGAGRPRRHGTRSNCSDPASPSPPDDELVADDPRYGQVRVQAWHNLHPRLHGRGHWSDRDTIPIIKGTVIRVDVEHLPKSAGGHVNKTLWLWWSGPGVPDLDRCFRAYLHRFDIEHGFRFKKGTLGWTNPSICTAEAGPVRRAAGFGTCRA